MGPGQRHAAALGDAVTGPHTCPVHPRDLEVEREHLVLLSGNEKESTNLVMITNLKG